MRKMKAQIVFRLPDEMVRNIDRAAKKLASNGMGVTVTRGDFIRDAVLRRLKELDDNA